MTENKNRCVVTGLGMISAIGSNVDECYKNALDSVSGIKETTTVDTQDCYAKLAAEVKFDLDSLGLDPKMDRVSKLCIKATKEAMEDANLKFFNNDERVSVIIGSCVGGVVSIEHYYKNNKNKEDITQMPISAIASQVAGYCGASGVVTNIANACAAGTMSISYACDLIREGKADIVIAGGSDAFASVPYAGFLALHALDSNPCSPFNHCTGITLGEGAGICVVESYEHALKRKAKMYCEVLGSGISSDAHHITAPRPDGEGQMNAINWAIKSSGLNANDIDYINAHGTGTAKNDNAEFLSLHTIFDPTNDHLSVSSTKAMVGHCLGAAGAIEAVFSIKCLTTNKVLPTLGYSEEDLVNLKEKAGNIDFVPNKPREKELKYVMSNSFAFGGNNASIIFGKTSGDVKSVKKHKVCLTGFGLVSPLGNSVDAYLEAIKNDSHVESGNVHSVIAKEDFASVNIPMSFYRKLDTISQIECVSGAKALQNRNLTVTDENATDIGIVIGTSEGALGMGCVFEENINEKGNKEGSAFKFPNTVYNAAGGYLSISSGLKGYNVTITNGAQSGLHAIAYAKSIIDEDKEKVVLASGVDENIDVTTELYSKLGLVNDNYVEPYQQDKKFVLADGASTIIVEDYDYAKANNAKVSSLVLGCGMAHENCAFGTISGSDMGLDKAINLALKDANLEASDIDAIVGFGNGIDTVDNLELSSYLRTFGDKLESLPIFSTKMRTGEARAMSASLNAMLASLMLDGTVEKEKAYIVKNDSVELTTVETKSLKKILVTAYGAGGSYTAVILGKEE